MMKETMAESAESKLVLSNPEDLQTNEHENQTQEQTPSEMDASNLTSSESSEGEPVTASDAAEEKPSEATSLLDKESATEVRTKESKGMDGGIEKSVDTTTKTTVQPNKSDEIRSVPLDIVAPSKLHTQNIPNPGTSENDKSALESDSGTKKPPVARFFDTGSAPQPLLLSLPIDSLHTIASFLLPAEWASFGETNKPSTRICKEIFRRVRMHGFRCATEVVTAWVSWFNWLCFLTHSVSCFAIFNMLPYSLRSLVISETRTACRCQRTLCFIH